MDITDLILQNLGPEGLAHIGAQVGLDPDQTQNAIEALAPALAAGVRRNTASPDGLAGLLAALAQGNHAQYVEQPRAVEFSAVKNEGDAILGHVFGSKDVSRAVALQAAGSTGVPDSILKKLLPIIAPMVMGAIAKMIFGGGSPAQPAPQPAPRSAPSGGGLGDILGEILGGGRGGSGGGLGDILGQVLGGGGARRAPQPEPQRRSTPSGGGLGDILGEIFGGGDESAPQADHPYARTRDVLDDILGRGTPRGDAGDVLLDSVEDYLRNR